VDPSTLVHGVTKERLDKDPALANYMMANFPEAFEQQEEASDERPATTEEEWDEEEPAQVYVKKEQPVYPLNIRPLTTYLRDPVNEEGSRNSRRLRRERMIPGLLYGSDPTQGIYSHQPDSKIYLKTPWKLLESELDRYHRSFESRVYNLTVLQGPDDDTGGTVHRVVPQNVQRHPVAESIYCANFCRYHAGRPLKLPLQYINEEESPALKRDGFVVPINKFVECFVEEGVSIPESLEVECTDLQMKEVIRLDRVLLPEGVRYSERVKKRGNEFILGVIFGSRRGEEEEGEGGEEEEEEEEDK
jgi:large subunit ribosomal protein L25